MRAISFAWTTPALVAGFKDVTRRDWNDAYAAQHKAGQLLAAWDKQPRFKGAKRVGTIRLVEDPYKQMAADIPAGDYYREGFEFLTAIDAKVDGLLPDTLFNIWKRQHSRPLWVVRFELCDLTVDGELLLAKHAEMLRNFQPTWRAPWAPKI